MPARFNTSLLSVEQSHQHQFAPNTRPRSVGKRSVEQNELPKRLPAGMP